ncbi:hypothetical protein JXC34_00035 [Candidatus Woesearchaeota archaeon]|nr:hypothetical protein [Candidatus Woesearchaeota archaeon]
MAVKNPQMDPRMMQNNQYNQQPSKAALNMYEQQRMAMRGAMRQQGGGPNLIMLLILVAIVLVVLYFLVRFGVIDAPTEVTRMLEGYGLL